MTETTDTVARRAIGYVRVSTEGQAETGHGLAAQRAAVADLAARRGWTLVRVYDDAGLSGADRGRPGLAAALADLGPGDVLVAAKLDRLSRSLGHLCDVLDAAERIGADVLSADVGIDTGTPMGRAVAQLAGTFAELERSLARERTRDALAARRARGLRNGPAPTLPEPVRRRIADARDRGESFRAIADQLNADAVPTARGGARWYASTVRAVCQSVAYDAELQAAAEGVNVA